MYVNTYIKVLKSSLLLVITVRRCLVTEHCPQFVSLSKPWHSLVKVCK